jgi:hypothetical protein
VAVVSGTASFDLGEQRPASPRAQGLTLSAGQSGRSEGGQAPVVGRGPLTLEAALRAARAEPRTPSEGRALASQLEDALEIALGAVQRDELRTRELLARHAALAASRAPEAMELQRALAGMAARTFVLHRALRARLRRHEALRLGSGTSDDLTRQAKNALALAADAPERPDPVATP